MVTLFQPRRQPPNPCSLPGLVQNPPSAPSLSRFLTFPPVVTMPLFHFLFLAALASTEPLRPRPSPISPHISATSYAAHSAYPDLAPTPIPELRLRDVNERRQLDTLGMNDPSTCNVGVCASSLYCTVFGDNPITASTVMGLCCIP